MTDKPADVQPIWDVAPDKIHEALRRIAAAAHRARVILFGSRARDAKRHSVLDLRVIDRNVNDTLAKPLNPLVCRRAHAKSAGPTA